MISPHGSLLTDLYELTMLQSYDQNDMTDTAVFEFFVRSLPPGRGYLVAAGLQPVLEVLENLRFTAEEIAWLKQSGRFDTGFLERLQDFHFQGDVHAMPEGTVFFPNEPIVRVTAPIAQAQFIETRLVNLLHFQCLIASKATRCVKAARGARLVDFGLRRAHGAEAGVLAARASYLGGFDATSAVVAGPLYGVPLAGTMAHSFVQAHDDEDTAFEHFARSHPDNVVLLIDTYDTEESARRLQSVAIRLQESGIRIKAVRLDSGDLARHAVEVRRILDAQDLGHVQIVVSGGLDEIEIEAMMAAGAPIDGFGVGSQLTTSSDASVLDCAYKLVQYAGRPRRKLSENKTTWPAPKQVFRRSHDSGKMQGDIIALADEQLSGEPLLQPVMQHGRTVTPPEPLDLIRDRLRRQLEKLPDELGSLLAPDTYPVSISERLQHLARDTDRWIRTHNETPGKERTP